ncbi:MAG: biotin transporter BioY [Burkholderiales bacterium]|nr:biotin transporter BioY [Burkholderiales bacterium]MCZ2441836.1 biotin transporter BioY [Burkholderiales bacterium]
MSQPFSTAALVPAGNFRRLKQLGLLLAGTAILTVSSQLSVPLWPVPVTMQTLAVLMIGALYGWRLGSLTVVAWLLEAALGLPVLAGGKSGLAAFAGPTAGFLFAFPLGAALAGWLVERGWDGTRPLRAFCGLFFCSTLMLLLGGAWLATLAGPAKAWLLGVQPFVLGDVLKSALGASTLTLWSALRVRRAAKRPRTD